MDIEAPFSVTVISMAKDSWLGSGMEGPCPECGQESGFHDDDGTCDINNPQALYNLLQPKLSMSMTPQEAALLATLKAKKMKMYKKLIGKKT